MHKKNLAQLLVLSLHHVDGLAQDCGNSQGISNGVTTVLYEGVYIITIL